MLIADSVLVEITTFGSVIFDLYPYSIPSNIGNVLLSYITCHIKSFGLQESRIIIDYYQLALYESLPMAN